jgi:hypothetical protein
MQIARRPDRRRAHVAGKHCIFGRQLIQNVCDVLRRNRGSARFTHGEIVEALASIFVVAEACIEIGPVGLALDQRSQHLERVLHISNQAKIDRSAASNLVAEPIHLNDLCVLGIELLIGKAVPSMSSASQFIIAW